ncbi:amidohydrolase [Hespellia stercorisuis]|uniref:Uncharacterized protein n=1 Tax=Hespellia stercorisuis DSM 15480 TaxID=1121950 RepID=A0A1M6WPX3_9FIRM|nr:amidohydrolase [Hespellia stercorisuis]SHK95696.1 hypothetical protein SAMN02745243_04068 [Hespellia stercorisuis DSM 15480]
MKKELYTAIDNQLEDMKNMSQKIWEYAETAFEEFQSCELQKEYLQKKDFM